MRNVLVCGVVISYCPSSQILKNVEVLSREVGHVVVVDNTPDPGSVDVLSNLEYLESCTVIRNHNNLGIATALNIGIRHAIAMGFLWIVTFDQDSQVRDGYIEEMLSAYWEAATHTKVGILFPRYEDARLGIVLPTHRNTNGDVVACMTSGSMMQAETFQACGPMEDAFFIDYVDLEYCLRMRAAGLKVIECPKAILAHSLGRITQHIIFGKKYTTTNHSAKRRYYITRNRLILIRRYFSKDREWALADFTGMVKETAKIFLAEQDKVSKTRYMVRAIWDAIFNRLGQRVPL
ncbi:MAG: glycosyltransferase family 2 protein [Acidobacteriaceae bacterium]